MIDIDEYIEQVKNNKFIPMSAYLYKQILDEGYVDDLNEYYDTIYDQNSFEYLNLKLTKDDIFGLKMYDKITLDKFNRFDIKLKNLDRDTYPRIVDFIDYDLGKVFVVKLKEFQI